MLKKTKKTAVIAAAAMAAAMATVPVFAAPAAYPEGSWATGKATGMEKYLILDSDAAVPNATFNFSITGDSTGKPATADTLAIIPVNSTTVSGTPTIGTAVFAPTDTKYDTPQQLQSDLDGNLGNRLDPVTLGTGQSYAKHTVSVDFSGVKFKEPGVYRYYIQETTQDSASIDVKDEDGKYLDVYVEHMTSGDNAGKLQVTGYVLHNDNGTVSADGSHLAENTKDGGFLNEYLTRDLTFSKTVSGNQASRDKYFKFTVVITGGSEGDKINVDLSHADASIAANPNPATTQISEAYTAPTVLTLGAGGTVTQDFYLQGGQSIVLKGIANGAAYSVTEVQEDYSPSVAVTGDTEGVTTTGNNSAADTHITADTTAAFTNTRQGTVPTGIMMTVVPGALAILCGGAGATYILKGKKRREE